MHRRSALALAPLLLLLLAAGPSCSSPVAEDRAVDQVDLGVEVVDTTVVFGGPLLLNLTGANLLRPVGVTVHADGDAEGDPIDATMVAEWEEDGTGLRVTVPWTELSRGMEVVDHRSFEGSLIVEVDDLSNRLAGQGKADDVALDFVEGLQPVFFPRNEMTIYLNEEVIIPAGGLLREQEGENSLLIWGEMEVEGERLPVNEVLPIEIGDSREEARVRFPARVFGVRPGVCDCELVPRNQRTGEELVLGPSHRVQIVVKPTELDSIQPTAAGRGETFSVIGRGLVPPNSEAGISMFFELDGTLMGEDGATLPLTGERTVLIAPDAVPDYTEAQVALRTETMETDSGDLVLTGISATPGEFRGTVTPILVEADRLVRATPIQTTITITPPHQYVYVKFLPTFSIALETFGLRNVEADIRGRIFDVVQRDYFGVGVTFSPERPERFVEYSVIEVGGPDPNGVGLFGLDNTEGKDVGNIRLNDIIGGENADVREQGYLSFGGVFIESFSSFSPTLHPEQGVADPMFDEIFGPFMPELGGTPVTADEWPGGERAAEIDMAIHALGSLIGDSLAHEIGHSLGLSWFPEDEVAPTGRFHNPDDEEGSIMDEGTLRPFGERAELDGFAVPRFNDRNMEYLLRILPPRE